MPTYHALHYKIAFKCTNKTPSIWNRTERCAPGVHSVHSNCNTMFSPLNQTRANTPQNACILCYSNPPHQLFCFTDLFLLCCTAEYNHLTIQPYNLDIIWLYCLQWLKNKETNNQSLWWSMIKTSGLVIWNFLWWKEILWKTIWLLGDISRVN